MKLRSHIGVISGKATRYLLRLSGRGGGSLPGLITQRLAPSLLSELTAQCPEGIVLISGTNGKTTTTRMLAAMLQKNYTLVHNRTGSNMTRGHLTAFISQATWRGKIQADLGLLEVDEAVLPEIIRQTKPRIVLLHNLFRDQLDRYGEVNTTAAKWLKGIKEYLPENCWLIVNADDPNLAYLAKQSGHTNVLYYGLDDPSIGVNYNTSVVDAYISPASKLPLSYTTYYLSHLGEYFDKGSNFKRPLLNYSAQKIIKSSENGSTFTFTSTSHTFSNHLSLPGIYNIYNAVAATSIALTLGVDTKSIGSALSNFTSVFGRYERIAIGNHTLTLCLIKNPAGANEVLRTLREDSSFSHLAIFANDNFADGIDVSWYWDTDYERIIPSLKSLICSGTRAEDIALRCKYAGFQQSPIVINQVKKAFELVLDKVSTEDICVLCTYTAALQIQKELSNRKIKKNYWHE